MSKIDFNKFIKFVPEYIESTSVIEKFVINRENQGYFYVEGFKDDFSGVQYRIFHSKENSEVKSLEDFYNTYGNDYMLSVYRAVLEMDSDIYEIKTEEINRLVSNLTYLKSKLKQSNEKNPSLWGLKNTLLTTIDTYNSSAEVKKDDDDSYIIDYNRLNGEDIGDILERIRTDKVA